MMAVCPTLGTAAVGVTQAGRRDGGRRLAHAKSNERRNFAGACSSSAMPQRRHTICAALMLELGHSFRVFGDSLNG
jgi:hypothetical protein